MHLGTSAAFANANQSDGALSAGPRLLGGAPVYESKQSGPEVCCLISLGENRSEGFKHHQKRRPAL